MTERLLAPLVIVAGIAVFCAGLVALLGGWGLIAGGVLMAAFCAVGIPDEDA